MRKTLMHITAIMLTCGAAAVAQEAEVPDWEATPQDNYLHVHVHRWPADRKIELTPLHNPLKSITLQGHPDAKVTLHPGSDVWVLHLPKKPAGDELPLITLEMIGEVRSVRGPAPVVTPDDDGTLTLPAHLAQTHGDKLRYEPQPHKNTLGYWTHVDDHATWQVRLEQGGAYEVIVYQGCGKGHGGSRAGVEVAGQMLEFTVEDTGHFQNFIERDIGTVQLEPGQHTLTVKALTKAKAAVMDVRRITLQRK